MENKFMKYLFDPENLGNLDAHLFEVENDNVISGLLVNNVSSNSYPIIKGVPIMLANGFSKEFLERFSSELSKINDKYSNKLSFGRSSLNWSFSSEWESFFEEDMKKTWNWTVKDRFEQFFQETETVESEIKDKIILDAGCGNGTLTERLSLSGGTTIGFDLSESVMFAEKNRKSKNLLYVRGDLQKLPFKDEFIDIMVSNGVIHHTPNTRNTFNSIARTIKPMGKLYIWLYSQKGNFNWRVKRKFFDYTRAIVCRLPTGLQDSIVNVFTNIFHAKDKGRDKKEVKISMYDSITPRWRHYHTPEEVSYWYYENGFGPITLTHFDNKYGFGVCGTKTGKRPTPGDNFGTKSKNEE